MGDIIYLGVVSGGHHNSYLKTGASQERLQQRPGGGCNSRGEEHREEERGGEDIQPWHQRTETSASSHMIPLPRARTENADSPKGNSGEVSGKLRITELQPCTLSDALAKRGGMLLLDASRRIGSCPTLSMEDLAGSPQGEEVAMASLPASEINPNARESASSAPKGRIPQRRNTLMIEVEVPAQSLLRSTSFASNDGSGEAMDIATPLVSSLPRDHSIGAKKSSPTGRQAARKAQSTWTHYTFPQIDSCSDKPCSTIEGFDLSHFGRRGDVTSHRQPHIPIHPQSTPATCSTRTPDGSPKERDRSCGSMGHWLNTDSNVGDNDDFPSFGRSWRSSEERQSGLSISAQPSPIASHVPPWGVLGSRTSSSMAFSGRFPAAVPPMPASPRSPVEVPTNERVRADPRLESKPGFFARMASLALLAGFRQGSGTFSPVSTGNFGSPVPSRPEDCSARSVDSVSMRSPLGSVASRDRQPSSSPSTSPERMGGNKTRGWSPVGRLQDDSEAALEFRTGEIHSGRGPVASSSNSSRRRWTFDDLRIWNSWRSKRSYSPESISYTGGYDVSALPGDCSDASKAQSLDTFELQSSAKKAKVLNTARKSATRSAMKKSASIRAGTQHQLQQASAAEWRANEMRTRRGSLTSSFDATGSFIRRLLTFPSRLIIYIFTHFPIAPPPLLLPRVAPAVDANESLLAHVSLVSLTVFLCGCFVPQGCHLAGDHEAYPRQGQHRAGKVGLRYLVGGPGGPAQKGSGNVDGRRRHPFQGVPPG